MARHIIKPRLLYIVNVDWFFLSHRLPIALAAQDAGFEIHVATAITGATDEIERYGFVVHPLDLNRSRASLTEALRLFTNLLGLLRHLSPSVVHLVTIKPVLIGGLAARVARTPRIVAAISGLGFVFTARGLAASLRRNMVSVLYRLSLSHERARVIFQNGDDQALLQRHAGIKDSQAVRIAGSGVNVSAWPVQPLPDSPPVVIMASRLLLDKGVREFVEAAHYLRGYRSARFVLVGDVDPGNPSSLTREQIESWREQGIIEWWGYRTDMANVLAQAHVIALPSYREGFPKVLIEAAASGRAVVTTDVPGCRDAIIPEVTGLLVPARDSLALANAIQKLLEDPQLCTTFGDAGRSFAEKNFDIPTVISAHMKIYQEQLRSA